MYAFLIGHCLLLLSQRSGVSDSHCGAAAFAVSHLFEDPGGARRNLGGPWRTLEGPGGPRGTQEDPGEPRRTQEDRNQGNLGEPKRT